jgi:hypothetical protein
MLTCPSGQAVEIASEDLRTFADLAVGDGMLSALAYGAACTPVGSWADGWMVVTLRTNRRVLAKDVLPCQEPRYPFEMQVYALDTKYCGTAP